LDRLSTALAGYQAEIEVSQLHLGHQVAAEWVPLIGVVYDPNDDVVEVALEGLDHMIAHPREIYLDSGTAGLASVEIVDDAGDKQVVRFRQPVLLPAPG
jgi:hypothetical protein